MDRGPQRVPKLVASNTLAAADAWPSRSSRRRDAALTRLKEGDAGHLTPGALPSCDRCCGRRPRRVRMLGTDRARRRRPPVRCGGSRVPLACSKAAPSRRRADLTTAVQLRKETQHGSVTSRGRNPDHFDPRARAPPWCSSPAARSTASNGPRIGAGRRLHGVHYDRRAVASRATRRLRACARDRGLRRGIGAAGGSAHCTAAPPAPRTRGGRRARRRRGPPGAVERPLHARSAPELAAPPTRSTTSSRPAGDGGCRGVLHGQVVGLRRVRRGRNSAVLGGAGPPRDTSSTDRPDHGIRAIPEAVRGAWPSPPFIAPAAASFPSCTRTAAVSPSSSPCSPRDPGGPGP